MLIDGKKHGNRDTELNMALRSGSCYGCYGSHMQFRCGTCRCGTGVAHADV